MKFVFAAFLVLHGLVHLLYFGQSARLFELKPGMAWPDGSWAFSKLLGNDPARSLADILLILAAVALIAGGASILLNQGWWRPVVVGAAALSILVYLLFWNGRLQNLDGQGAVGILIDALILVAVLLLRWPVMEQVTSP
jgi:hypothetical protein